MTEKWDALTRELASLIYASDGDVAALTEQVRDAVRSNDTKARRVLREVYRQGSLYKHGGSSVRDCLCGTCWDARALLDAK